MTTYEFHQKEEAYKDTINDIACVVDFIGQAIEDKENKEKTWADVCEMSRVRENLIDTLSFMTGFKKEEIENTLIECSLDGKT